MALCSGERCFRLTAPSLSRREEDDDNDKDDDDDELSEEDNVSDNSDVVGVSNESWVIMAESADG